MRATFLLGAGFLVLGTAAGAAPVIYIAGDSTAQTYDAKRYPMTGWGQMLSCAVRPGITIRNHAMAGRSTKTFIEEGRLDGIRREIKAGDTLLIQFGHNDANTQRPGRYAAPAGAYRDNLIKLIDVARSVGAQPVLITPVIRRNFVDGRVRADFTAWSNEVRKLAAEQKVPLIDLEALSGDWVQRAGPETAKAFYLHYKAEDKVAAYPKGIDDDTHFSELGARRVADIVAGGLRRLKLPVSHYVMRKRPTLTIAAPLGSTRCN